MKSKSKLLALSLALAVGAVSVVGGSLAWFSDTAEVKNTFTVGSVKIEQHEAGKDGGAFVQNAMLLPVLSNDTPEDDVNFIHKVITVENTGRNPAYIQTFVAVPAELDNNGLLHQQPAGNSDWAAVDGDPAAAGVQPVYLNVPMDDDGDTSTETVLYNVYKYRYSNVLPAPDGAQSVSSELLSGVYIDQSADLKLYRNSTTNEIEHAYFYVTEGQELTAFDVANMQLRVLVATQAVQSEGFTDAATALDTVFPNHPWVTP